MNLDFLVTTYHYVGENTNPYPAVYPISAQEFERQLDIIGERFTFVSLNDIVQSLNNERLLPENSCLITFDDGLKCQYDTAWPILKRKGIPAAFFVNTKPLITQTASLTHKIHWLRGNVEFNEFKLCLSKALKEKNAALSDFETDEVKDLAGKQYPYDREEVAVFKYIISFKMDWYILEKIIDTVFTEIYGSEDEFCKEYYFGKEECTILALEGVLGCHGHKHIPLSRLSFEEFESDFKKSLQYLQELTGVACEAVSYPFGGNLLDYDRINDIVKRLGIKVGFTTKKEMNSSLENSLFLGRYNTNDIPGGTKPIIHFSEEIIQ